MKDAPVAHSLVHSERRSRKMAEGKNDFTSGLKSGPLTLGGLPCSSENCQESFLKGGCGNQESARFGPHFTARINMAFTLSSRPGLGRLLHEVLRLKLLKHDLEVSSFLRQTPIAVDSARI